MTNANAQVAPKSEQVTLDVPPGLTAEQYQKLVETVGKQAILNQKKAKADGLAHSRLLKLHAEDWTKLRNEERKKLGILPLGARES